MKHKTAIKTVLSLAFVAAVFVADVSAVTFRRQTETLSGDGSGISISGAVLPDGMLIDLNTATAEELQKLPNIGKSRAAAIISYREANGLFLTADELAEVDGISSATLEKLRPYITVSAK